MKRGDPDAKIKFLAAEALRGVGGLFFDAFGHRFAKDLGRRDYVTGEITTDWAVTLFWTVVFGRVAGVACAKYVLGDRVKATSLLGKVERSKSDQESTERTRERSVRRASKIHVRQGGVKKPELAKLLCENSAADFPRFNVQRGVNRELCGVPRSANSAE